MEEADTNAPHTHHYDPAVTAYLYIHVYEAGNFLWAMYLAKHLHENRIDTVSNPR